MNRISCTLLLLSITIATNAQWTVKKSELQKSGLEQIYKASPYLVQVVPDKDWDASNFASVSDLQWHRDARFGMFIHFGLSTFKNKELSWGVAQSVMPDMEPGAYPREVWTSWADSLQLEKFSKEELAEMIKQSGVKYLVVVAKHHDGFHLWDTQYSDFKVTNSPYGKDFVREVLDACRMAGIKTGIYYSQRDWYHPDYSPVDPATIDVIKEAPYYRAKKGMTVQPGKNHHKYIEYQFNAIRELCSNYGKIDIFWFDAVYWNGMFTAEMWDAERLTRMIRELQPGIMINNRTSLPGDLDTPEQRIGIFQNYRPWESCMTLCDTWSYSPSRVKTPSEIFRTVQATAVGDGNLLLSWGMHWNGEWDQLQKQTFEEVGDALSKYGSSIYGTRGGPWLPGKWGGTTFKGNKVYVHIIHKPETGIVSLSKPKNFGVTKSSVLTGQSITVTENNDGYIIDLRQLPVPDEPVVIELTVSKQLTLDDVMMSNHK